MHRSIASVVLGSVVAVALAACADAPSAPSSSLRAPSAASRSVGGMNRTYNDVRTDVGMPIRVPCSRLGMEIVPLSGVEHASMQFSTNAAGRPTLRMHVNAQGVTGIGLVTGDTYRASGTTEESYDWDALGAADGYYLTYTFNVTSAGATGNIRAHELLRITFDADGYPTLGVVKFDAECS